MVYKNLYLKKDDMKISIVPDKDISYIDLSVSFSCGGIITETIESKLEFVYKLLKVFYSWDESVRITIDVSYFTNKVLNLKLDEVKSMLKEQLYIPKVSNAEEYRKFEVIKKHNVVSQIEVNENKDHTNLTFYLSIDNMIIDIENFQSEIINSAYYYLLEYIKLHFNFTKNFDKKYFNDNIKFYNSIEKNYKL